MSIDLQLINSLLVIALNLIGVLLVFWVYSSDRKRALNRGFALLLVPNLLWVNFYALASFINQYHLSLQFTRLTFAFAAIFFIGFYYFFIIWFLEEKRRYHFLGKIVICYEIIFSFLCAFTSLVLPTIDFGKFGIVPNFSTFGKITFYLPVIILVIIVIYRLMAKYIRSNRNIKNKIQYFLIGVFIFTISNFVIGVILPWLFNIQDYYFVTSYSTLFLITFTAYAIVKHKLMDIRMVVARSIGFLFLLISVAGFAGLLMMLIPLWIFGHETLDNPTYNILIRSAFGIILVFSFQPIKTFITKATDRIFFKNEYDSHELIKKITDTSHSTLMLIELLYKMVDLLIKEMKVSKGHFVLLDDGGDIHTTQAIGFQSSPDIKAADVKGLATHGILVLENLEDSSHFKKLLKKTDAAISVGLVDETGPIGALLLGEKNSGDMYSAKDIRVLGILATSISVAIQRAKEHEKVQNFNVYLQTEIARKTKELQEANDHLRELDAAKDEFISMASHQLRTPLTAIKGYLSMLIEGDAGEIKMAQFDFINEAFDGANRMVALINDLLNVSRMDTGRFFLEPVEIDLVSMVKQEVKQLEQAAKEKRLYLDFKTRNKTLKVKADETKIRQVVMNFIDNAVYYTPTGGITVTLESDAKNAIFKVTDTGMGVPESEKEKLFQKFFRADNARKSRPDGTGLGIYLAKKVIEDHGGEIIFESTEGKGSTFGFKLPIKSRIKKDITVPPADLATKVEAIGSGESSMGAEPSSVIFVSDKK